jgi:hypothetical protein
MKRGAPVDKREFTRIVFQTEVNVRAGERKFSGVMENLSLDGLFVRSAGGAPAGSDVDLTISLSGSTSALTIELKGVVVRQDGEGMAIRFREMDLDSFIHLRNIVACNMGSDEELEKEFSNLIRRRSH